MKQLLCLNLAVELIVKTLENSHTWGFRVLLVWRTHSSQPVVQFSFCDASLPMSGSRLVLPFEELCKLLDL